MNLEVFRLLTDVAEGERLGIKLLGHPVCNRTFRLALGIGKNRLQKLRHAALTDQICPVDARYRPRKHDNIREHSAQPLVADWLQRMYETVAEPLPESYSADAWRQRHV